jgi:hypothetical protein
VVVVALVDGVTPLVLSVELVPLAGPPMAPLPVVVDSGVAVPAEPLVEPDVMVPPGPAAGAPELLLEVDVSLLGAGVVVLDELEDDVVGVGASSRLVQAPSETAATSASAAHEVRDAFIRKLLKFVRK